MKIDSKLIFVSLFVIIIVMISYKLKSRENFNGSETTEENIRPVVYDKETGLITSGSEFIGMPDEVLPPWGSTVKEEENLDGLDDGFSGMGGLNYNMCSKSCCSQQYPPPFLLDHDEAVCKNSGKFVENNYKCNNSWQDSGCVCMTSKQKEFLSSRGGNA